MTEKPSNPKDICGIRKAPMSTISAAVLAEVGVAMMEGALKYGRHNYRAVGVRASVYYDGTMRHLMDWWEGVEAPEFIIEMERASLMHKITSFPVDSESQAAAWRVKEEMHRDEQDFLFANGYYKDVVGDVDDASQSA